MGDEMRRNLPFYLDGALLLALLGIFWKFAGWQSAMEERMRTNEAAIGTLSISAPLEARRLSVVEARVEAHEKVAAELKVDINRRFDRQDQKLDAIAERLDSIRNNR